MATEAKAITGSRAEPADDVTCSSAVIDKVLEIGRRRRQILAEMRAAIQRTDKDAVFALAQKLTGLSDEKSPRTNPRLN